ncbi:cell growth-regulating nucleolar protein [Cryptococcus neoformans Tu401-1]|nr:cell growth-regulating nucleolar protein [Cryptococcus neoformans var. grubii Tu401-1]
MVSFQCDACADTVKKPKLDQHRSRCFASFTCLDCSKTFKNPSEYKGHTSCISEAEKYQGALYKGSKKEQTQSQPQSVTPVSEAEPAASAPSIHPSRLRQMTSSSSDSHREGFQDRGTRGMRGGRGGRGGYQSRGAHNGGERSYASAMNKLESTVGMRSWGSPAVAESTPEKAEVREEVGAKKDEKKRKKKGDKGGTGSRANSKNARSEEPSSAPPETSEPKSKKRKIDDVDIVAGPENPSSADSVEPVSSKTIKRLKKRLSKLEEKQEMSLGELVDSLQKDEKKAVEAAEIMKGIKISFKDGSWILNV